MKRFKLPNGSSIEFKNGLETILSIQTEKDFNDIMYNRNPSYPVDQATYDSFSKFSEKDEVIPVNLKPGQRLSDIDFKKLLPLTMDYNDLLLPPMLRLKDDTEHNLVTTKRTLATLKEIIKILKKKNGKVSQLHVPTKQIQKD